MKRSVLSGVVCGWLAWALPTMMAAPLPDVANAVRRPDPARTGMAVTVRVPDEPLVFTGQVVAPMPGGEVRAEAAAAFAAADAVLQRAGAGLDRAVRLNLYVDNPAVASAVESVVAERFAARPVACTVICTPVADGRRVAVEVVAVRTSDATSPLPRDETAAVLPAGGKLFISGQAEKGTDVASAVRLTMAGLQRSLTHLGLTAAAVVQVKAFIRPMADHVAARREIAASFAGRPPPVVLIEWQSDLFAEIEVVAAAPGLTAKPGETVAHAWLPWLSVSPRYAHVAHVPAGVPLIFLGSIDGGDGDDRSQMKLIFERLGSILFDCGSSYRHLAKATYYLGGAPTRNLLGEIRGVYFDPTRPPAASALQVAAFAASGRRAAVEMIAVPVK